VLKVLKIFSFVVAAATSHLVHSAYDHQGSLWPLTERGSPLSDSDLLTRAYGITLAVDTSVNVGRGSFLDQVAINVGSSFADISLFDASMRTSTWSLLGGGVSARGCSGSGSGFFDCANGLSLRRANFLADGSSFSFDVMTVKGEFFSGFEKSPVKGRFVDIIGNKAGDPVLENGTTTNPAPEPQIYTMMLAGLGLMGYVARRRRHQGAVF